MHYIAVLVQEAACDYSICCGTKVVHLQSTEHADVVPEVTRLITENYSHEEQQLTSAQVYSVNLEFDMTETKMAALYKTIKDLADRERANTAEAREREEFLRLHKKFGGTEHGSL